MTGDEKEKIQIKQIKNIQINNISNLNEKY